MTCPTCCDRGVTDKGEPCLECINNAEYDVDLDVEAVGR